MDDDEQGKKNFESNFLYLSLLLFGKKYNETGFM